MIHLHRDGETLRNGINIYRYNNPYWGFVLRYGPKNSQGRATKILVVAYDRISKTLKLDDIRVD